MKKVKRPTEDDLEILNETQVTVNPCLRVFVHREIYVGARIDQSLIDRLMERIDVGCKIPLKVADRLRSAPRHLYKILCAAFFPASMNIILAALSCASKHAIHSYPVPENLKQKGNKHCDQLRARYTANIKSIGIVAMAEVLLNESWDTKQRQRYSRIVRFDETKYFDLREEFTGWLLEGLVYVKYN